MTKILTKQKNLIKLIIVNPHHTTTNKSTHYFPVQKFHKIELFASWRHFYELICIKFCIFEAIKINT